MRVPPATGSDHVGVPPGPGLCRAQIGTGVPFARDAGRRNLGEGVRMKENGSTALAASADPPTTFALPVLGAVAGLGVIGVVIGLRLASSGHEPPHQNWWIVAW